MFHLNYLDREIHNLKKDRYVAILIEKPQFDINAEAIKERMYVVVSLKEGKVLQKDKNQVKVFLYENLTGLFLNESDDLPIEDKELINRIIYSDHNLDPLYEDDE